MAVLPLFLAGPIVRRVEPRSCSIWVALRESANVTVTVWSGSQFSDGAGGVRSRNASLGTATAATKRFAPRLHIAVVQVKFPDAPLPPHSLFSYNMQVDASGGTDLQKAGLLKDETAGTRLADVDAAAPLHLALGYEQDRLPSFLTAAVAAKNLRLAHTSCRKPHASDFDAFAFLDDEIKEKFTNIDERTQLLFLTGDQIYADDVSPFLLEMVAAIGRDLLDGSVERIPVPEHPSTPLDCTTTDFPALRRERLVREKGGFTTTSGDSHLMSFAEFAGMYLAVWCPRVWRPLLDVDLLLTSRPPLTKDLLTDWESCNDNSTDKWMDSVRPKLIKQKDEELEAFRKALPKVARVLANLQTYMICDDHEVTDDWNLNQKWRNRVFRKPLGVTIVRNALMAYGVFQGWGNDPGAFESGNNADFLTETAKLFQGDGPFPAGDTARMDELLGSTDSDVSKRAKWHYRVLLPTAMVIVLDTRTRRGFTGQSYAPPNLLGDSLGEQVGKGPFTDGRELLILVSAAPVLGPNIMEQVAAPVAQMIHDVKSSIFDKLAEKPHDPCKTGGIVTGAEEYDAEGWSGHEKGFEDLLAALASYGRVVILSGDVHYAASLSLDYWEKTTIKGRILQCTSSGAHNPFSSTVSAILRNNALLQRYQAGEPVERIAWKEKSPINLPAGAKIGPGRRARKNRSPSLLPAQGWPAGSTIPPDKPPDWLWRVRLLRDSRPNSELPPGLQLPVFSAGQELNPADALPAYKAVASNHAMVAFNRTEALRQMVFTANIGLVEFADSGGKMLVRHVLLSRTAPDSEVAGRNTVHELTLELTSDGAPHI